MGDVDPGSISIESVPVQPKVFVTVTEYIPGAEIVMEDVCAPVLQS